jgi:putative flippase GtrA
VSAPGSERDVRQLLQEVFRFLVVGGLATTVSVLGFNALVHGIVIGSAPLAERPVTAFVLANAVAGLVAFVGMRAWAFSRREVLRPARSLVRFFVLGALTMAIPVLCLAVSRYLLGRSDPWSDNISANVIGLGLGTATRFWVFRRYVFLEPGESLPDPSRA